jgi:predicted transcriptional regulator
MVTKAVPEVEDDRVLGAVRHAPIVESTPEEMAAFEEGLADIRAGRTVSPAEVRARLQTREKE